MKGGDIKDSLLDAYEEALKLHMKMVQIHVALRNELQSIDEITLVDIGFLEREVSDQMDAARKEANRWKDMASKVLSARLTEEMIADGKTECRTVRGEFASGSPDVAVMPVMPKKGEPEYAQLLDSLGIEVASDTDPGMVSLSFTRIRDLCTARASEGQDPPAGIKGTFPQYTVTYRRLHGKKGQSLR